MNPVTQQVPLNAADLLPIKVLGDELPLDAYWKAFQDFAMLAVPCVLIGIGAVIASIELGKRGADLVVFVLLWLLAALMVGLIVFAYDAYQQRVEDYRNRQQTRRHAIMMLSLAVQNLTINQIDVRGRNNSVMMNQAQVAAAPILDATNTQVYNVALHIAEKAIQSWNLNNGKRERPKPFSAQAMASELSIGGETWQASIDLVNAAGVMHGAGHATAWRVVINDMKQAERALHMEMLKRGYSSEWHNGVQSWYKIVPSASPTPDG